MSKLFHIQVEMKKKDGKLPLSTSFVYSDTTQLHFGRCDDQSTKKTKESKLNPYIKSCNENGFFAIFFFLYLFSMFTQI